jgi:hypothetical protein
MRRIRWLSNVLAVMCLGVAMIPNVWESASGSGDPRTHVGTWTWILHGGQVVVRTGDNVLHTFEVGATFSVCWFYFLIWLTISTTGGLLRVMDRRRQARALRQAIRLNCCVACGYDLRATPQRCPECGTVPDESNLNEVEVRRAFDPTNMTD